MHDTASGNTDALKLKVRNAQDDQRKGGVHPARDSLGWSVAQRTEEGFSTMGENGQIGIVHDFLTDGGAHNDEMRNFAQYSSEGGDTIGDKKIDYSVWDFANPLVSAHK